MATTSGAVRTKSKEFFEQAYVLQQIKMKSEPFQRGLIPLRLASLYQFTASNTKLQANPKGEARILPGIMISVPGNPLRLNETQQFIGFSDLRVKDDIPQMEIVPADVSAFGLIFSSAPIVRKEEDLWTGTMVKAPEGAIGFSFYTTRKFEINVGFVICYLKVME